MGWSTWVSDGLRVELAKSVYRSLKAPEKLKNRRRDNALPSTSVGFIFTPLRLPRLWQEPLQEQSKTQAKETYKPNLCWGSTWHAFLSSGFLFRKGLGSGTGLLKMLTDDVTVEEKTQTLGRRQDDYPKLVISRDQGEFNWNSMDIRSVGCETVLPALHFFSEIALF